MDARSGYVPEDIFRHRVLDSLTAGTHHGYVAMSVTRALQDTDDYETVIWGVALEPAGQRPRALTSTAHGASSPQLDPAGRVLAFLSKRGNDGKQVHLLRLDGGEARALTRAADVELAGISQWSADGAQLLLTARVPWQEDGEVQATAGHKPPQVARYLPYKRDGTGIVVGTRTHLYAANAGNGRLVQLTAGDFNISAAAWSADGRQLAYVRNCSGRQRHRSELWIADALGGEPRCLLPRLASIDSIAWSPDGQRIGLAATETEGDSFLALWFVDARDGHLQRLGDDDFEVESGSGVHWHADGKRIAVIASHRGVQALAVVSLVDGRPTLHCRGLRHVKAIAASQHRIAFVSVSMRRPDELHSMDWEGGGERRHGHFNRGWSNDRPRPRVAKRRFRVPDGNGGDERVDAWVLRPADGGGPFPLLVDFHGGPHSIVRSDFAAHTYWYLLLSRGWAILAVNALGSSSYGHGFARRLRGQWGTLDLPQHLAVLEKLKSERLADERVACAGKSYGGFLSAWALGTTEAFKACIVCAPLANLESHAGTSDTGYYTVPYLMDAELDGSHACYHQQSPVAHARNAHSPTLILQGENDQRCPRGQSEELFARLIRTTAVPVEMVIYPGSSHAEAESGRPSNRLDYHRRIADWAERWAGRG